MVTPRNRVGEPQIYRVRWVFANIQTRAIVKMLTHSMEWENLRHVMGIRGGLFKRDRLPVYQIRCPLPVAGSVSLPERDCLRVERQPEDQLMETGQGNHGGKQGVWQIPPVSDEPGMIPA